MDKSTREILQKTMQLLISKGYKVITEFALPNKKRVDIIGINSKKKIVIIEVKSNKNNFKNDNKWKKYLKYCNYFYFSCSEEIKNIKFPRNVGFILCSYKKNIKISKYSQYKKISESVKNKLIHNYALSAASKFHRLIDPQFNKKSNNSIYVYKK